MAAFGVLIYHVAYRAPEIDHLGGASFPEWTWWTRYLHLGVQLFFMISGFVIFWSAEGKTAGQFAWSRLVRLYPAFWVCCTLTFIVCHHWWQPYYTLSVQDWLVNMTMLQQFFHVPHVDAPYWTLTEEMRFYGLTFVLILIKQQHRRMTFVAVWMVLSAVDFYVHKIPLARYEMTLQFAPMFAAGIVYFDIFKRGPRLANVCLLPVCFFLGLARFLSWEEADAVTGAVCSPITVSAIFVAMFAVFLLIAMRKLRLNHRGFWLTAAGGITYPLYLIHNRLGLTLMLALQPSMGRWGQLLLTVVGACFAAYAIWRWIELPTMAALRRLGKRGGL